MSEIDVSIKKLNEGIQVKKEFNNLEEETKKLHDKKEELIQALNDIKPSYNLKEQGIERIDGHSILEDKVDNVSLISKKPEAFDNFTLAFKPIIKDIEGEKLFKITVEGDLGKQVLVFENNELEDINSVNELIPKTYSSRDKFKSNDDFTLERHKKIDYLGDDEHNADTNLKGQNSYRQYIDVKGVENKRGIDFLFVVDATSSMTENDFGGRQRDEVTDEIINGAVGKSTKDGLLTKLLSINKKNNVALITFVGTRKMPKYYSSDDKQAKIVLDWNKLDYKDKADYTSVLYSSGTGTNYCAALLHAAEMFKSEKIRNNGNRKVMIFISDGEPNQSIKYEKKKSRYKYETKPKDKYRDTLDILDVFQEKTNPYTPDDQDKVDIQSIAISLHNKEILRKIAESGGGKVYSAYQKEELVDAFDSIISSYFPNDVKVEDSLSSYVNLNTSQPDFKLKMFDSNNTEKIIWEGGLNYDNTIGHSINNGSDMIESVKFDKNVTSSSNGKITIKFKPSYALGNNRFEMSYNLEVSKNAGDYLLDNGFKYPNNGDVGTDYSNNTTTSSGKQGFNSNEYAKVTYKKEGEYKTEEYKHPVVQVKPISLQIKKVDSLGNPLGDAKFSLYKLDPDKKNNVSAIKLYDNENLSGKTKDVFTTETKGEINIYGLFKGTYYLKEVEAPTGFNTLDHTLKFELKEDGTISLKADKDFSLNDNTIIVKNEFMGGFELPKTGGLGTSLYKFTGLLVLAISCFIPYRKKQLK